MKASSIVLLGAGGQLGQTIQADWQRDSRMAKYALHCLPRSELDITNAAEIDAKLSSLRPGIIVNAASFTAVDRAESERAEAFRINRDGAQRIAEWADQQQCRLIHISTDFVFDGKTSRPYTPSDETNPVNSYGASKVAGEQAVIRIHGEGSVIIRTSWLYSRYQSNFMKTMLKLMATKDHLRVVADQVGSPTSTHTLAQLIASVAESDVMSGIYHWSDAGVASWYDFAVAIQEEALAAGLLQEAIPIEPISSWQYPTPAARPAFSVMDKSLAYATFSCRPSHWRTQLRLVIQELAERI